MKTGPSFLLLAVLAAPVRSQPLAETYTDAFAKAVGAATRLPTPAYDSSRVPGPFRVIDRKEIEASDAGTLQDLLSRQPGVVMFDQVGNPRQRSVDLRGFNATPIPTTIVLVDGVRVNETDFGQVNWQLLPLSAVERVELLPGAQTVFGKNAVAGVVNVVTRKGGATKAVEAEAAFGSFELQRYAAAVSGPAGPLRYVLGASRETDHGYRGFSGSRIHRFDSRLDFDDGDTSASVSYRYGDDDIKQAGALTASEITRDRDQNVSRVEMDSMAHLVALNARRRLIGGLSASGNAFARKRLENTPVNRGRTSISRSRGDMLSNGLTGQLEHDAEVLGRRSIFTGGAEGVFTKTDADSSGAFGAFPFVNGSVSRGRQLGVFAQETFDLWPEKVVLTGGVRWDHDRIQYQDKLNGQNDGERGYHRASPRVGINVNPLRWLQLYGSLAESFRSPTPNEISALGPFAATPFLKPVKARTVEAGIRVKRPSFDATATVYRTVTKDEIYAVFDPTAFFGQNRNIDKIRRDGVELTVEPRWNGVVDGFVRYAFTEATFQNEFTLDKPPFGNTQVVSIGDALPQVPRHRLSFGANVHPLKGLTVSADETCRSSQHVFGDESNTEPRLGGVCLLGLGASYETGGVRFFMRAENALDKKYESRGILATNPATFAMDRFLIPAPGIMVSGGVSYRWAAKP
jgi:iron complex outermembrane recepter protein